MNAKYSGWSLLKKVKIVYSNNDYITVNNKKIPKAYVVDASNKKSLETAISWAAGYSNAEAKIIDTDNSDFSFTIGRSAMGSTQGGKLSFWMCIMSKKDVPEFSVGINADLLVNVLLQSTFIDGKCQEKVMFARQSAQLGVLHRKMSEYEEALHDEELKSSISKNKTSNWKIGYEYNTVTKSDMLLGYFKCPVQFKDERVGFGYNYTRIVKIDFNTKSRPFIVHPYKNKDGSLDWKSIISNDFMSYDYHFISKCPSRQEGTQLLNEKAIEKELPEKYLKYISTEFGTGRLYEYAFFEIIGSAFILYDKYPEITKQILERSINWIKLSKERWNCFDLYLEYDGKTEKINNDIELVEHLLKIIS